MHTRAVHVFSCCITTTPPQLPWWAATTSPRRQRHEPRQQLTHLSLAGLTAVCCRAHSAGCPAHPPPASLGPAGTGTGAGHMRCACQHTAHNSCKLHSTIGRGWCDHSTTLLTPLLCMLLLCMWGGVDYTPAGHACKGNARTALCHCSHITTGGYTAAGEGFQLLVHFLVLPWPCFFKPAYCENELEGSWC